MISTKRMLASSIVLNAVLAGLWWHARSAQLPSIPATAGASPAAVGPARLVKSALAAGIPEPWAYQLALLGARAATAPSSEEYWRAPIQRLQRQQAADRHDAQAV